MDAIILLVAATELLVLLAGAIAAWQVRARQGRLVWLLITGAIALLAVRYLVTLRRLISGELEGLRNFPAEAVTFLASLLLVWGVLWLAGLLRAMRRQQAELRSVNRALTTLSHCNQVLARATTEGELLQQVCHAIVESGGYRLAWVGMAEQDAAKTVRPVAHAGYEQAYVDGLTVSWADDERGRGPAGAAIRTGAPHVVQNIASDPGFAPWRAEAIAHGYRSSAGIPLIAGGRAFGALVVHAPEPDAFGPSEVRLLGELTEDLVFGISALRERARGAQATAGLRDSEERFRRMFEGAPIAIGLADMHGRLVACNLAYHHMLGYAAGELVGKGFTEFTHPDDVAADAVLYRQLVTGERDHYVREKRYLRKDGRPIWGSVAVALVRDAAGTPTMAIGMIQDVTERKRAEEALRRSEADYRALVEHATYGVYRASADGRFLTVNPALVAMLGYASAEELFALQIERDVYRDAAAREALLGRYAEAERVPGVEVEWKRKDGRPITVRLSGRPIHDERGALACFEMIAEDVTQQRVLEAQLRQAQKMEAVGQLTGGIAHDFNNILTVIMSNAGLVRDRLPDGAVAARAELADLLAAADRGATMIRRLLGFSRRESLAYERVDLARLVSDVARTLQRLLPENVRVETTAPEGVPAIRADAGALQQILLNLATNARDAMPAGGTLTFRVDQDRVDTEGQAAHPWVALGDYVRITVRDTGAGMDEATRARVFEPFFTTKPRGVGTGLGLAMAYGLMKQHRGYIHVYSEPGNGTEVKLHFPIEAAVAPEAGAPAEPYQASLPVGSETILLVEDEAAIRRTAARALTGQGYAVLQAADGEEALDLFRRHESAIALVISDLMMPKMGGRELYEALRHRRKRVRFLFTTGYAAADLATESLWALGQGVLHKPWTLGELLGRVREVLDRPPGR